MYHFRTDFNECAYHNGGCSHNCKNTNGSYHCSCPDPELSLALDNHSCIGEYPVILNKGGYVKIIHAKRMSPGNRFNVGKYSYQLIYQLISEPSILIRADSKPLIRPFIT